MNKQTPPEGFRDDYRVTRTAAGLRIEVLDYHAGPLTLTCDELAELGYVRADAGDDVRKRRSQQDWPESTDRLFRNS